MANLGRTIEGVTAGSNATITLTLKPGSTGTFLADAWDLKNPSQVQSAVLVPGTNVMGPLHPPSAILIEGLFHTAVSGVIVVECGNEVRRVTLNGPAGGSMVTIISLPG